MPTIAENVNARIAKIEAVHLRQRTAFAREQFERYFNNKKAEIIAISETADTKTLINCDAFDEVVYTHCPGLGMDLVRYLRGADIPGGVSLIDIVKNNEVFGPIFGEFVGWAKSEGLVVSVECHRDNLVLDVAVP